MAVESLETLRPNDCGLVVQTLSVSLLRRPPPRRPVPNANKHKRDKEGLCPEICGCLACAEYECDEPLPPGRTKETTKAPRAPKF